MNNLIRLKGPLNEKKNLSTPGQSTFSANRGTSVEKLISLKEDLQQLYIRWRDDKILEGALVSVFYDRIVPKSKRIKTLLSKGSELSNNSIRGAKFSENGEKHIITHFVSLDTIKNNIEKLNTAIYIMNKCFDNYIDNEKLKTINDYKSIIEKNNMSKSTFINIVTDACNVEKFGILDNAKNLTLDTIINLYEVGMPVENLMSKIGITNNDYIKIDNNVIKFKNIKSLNIFTNNVSYLVSMSTTNISQYNYYDCTSKILDCPTITIRDPKNEPVIGVIDTLFDQNVYFNKWVEYHDLVDENIPKSSKDYEHGTSVTSIIVDGPSFNPQYEDGCGNFKVRHFGVAVHGKNSSLTIIKNIERVVEENPDIHVWNLSLGSELEINPNFISPEAALIDRIQCEKNVIFVIAGTNDNDDTLKKKIGSPADSINALVVNSLSFSGKIPSYARKGNVLSFFNKPDVSYYGGDKDGAFITCIGTGVKQGIGTSYAAPWISRKMSYLIDVMGLTREIAKALIIDSATNWNYVNDENSKFIGFGKVPVHINDIINSNDDEIKFYIEGTSNLYDTYTHNIPVPLYKDKYPFIAKATLCYFPKCSRNQGVDYTNTELDIYFGRIDNKGNIKSINQNIQSEGNELGIKEKEARQFYRKWDNVKHITQVLKNNIRPKQKYDNVLWGLSIKSKERLEKRDGEGIKFGVVITLKEINGVNRMSEFINQCSLRGWLVNKVDIKNRIDIYNTAQEDVKFD